MGIRTLFIGLLRGVVKKYVLLCRQKEIKEMKIVSGVPYDETEIKRLLACSDDRVALIDEVRKIPECSVKTEDYLMILCTGGMASININDNTYHAEKNDFMFCHPNMILANSMYSADFTFKGIVLSRDFAREFGTFLEGGWGIMVNMDRVPIVKFTDRECGVFNHYWDLLYEKLSGEHLKHHNDIIGCLLMAFAYEMRDCAENLNRSAMPQFKSSEKLFNRFMEILTSTFPKHREVAFYAKQLCVSPKYLSAVCKQISGETASDIIYKYIISDIKYTLRQRDLSVKQVAFKLGFHNISFFGKYTKRALGMSPKAYRQSLTGI